MSGRLSIALLLAVTLGCGSGPSTPAPDAAGDVGPPPFDTLAACAGRAALTPRTIDEAIAIINTLPRPVSIACFVASLPRPLNIIATSSALSAQPAHGRRSPRVFLMTSQLIIAVVPAGPGVDLLEFGEWVEGSRTIKAEIEFPVTEELAPDAGYTRVRRGEMLTSCGLCHRAETEHPTIAGAFVSIAYQPEAGSVLPLWTLQNERAVCDPAAEPQRCEMLRALFDYGAVTQSSFRADVARFLGDP